ncbi:MAG: hypothetical protein FJ044_02315 [Candidatus Cloacimonetes bacterium]|nr:hypothetical protein [Candidatus Cloacimonadota bacterium]
MTWVEWLQFILIVAFCAAFIVVCGLGVWKAISKKEKEARKYGIFALLIIIAAIALGVVPDALHWFSWDFLHKQGKGPEVMQKAIDIVNNPPSPPGTQVTPTPTVGLEYEIGK